MLQLPYQRFQYAILNRAAIISTKLRSYAIIKGPNDNEISPAISQPFAEHAKRHITMVSTTRGSPSTCIDLKDAVREKIPLHYDLLREFRSQHGSSVVSRITVNDMYEGLKGINTLVRETSEFDSRVGVRYRGLTLPEVLVLLPRRGHAPSPEAVFWLLLTGDVPTYEQTASLVADWTLRRQRRKNCWLESADSSYLGGVIKALPKTVTPLGRLSIALTALESSDKTVKGVDGRRTMGYTYWEHTYEEGMELLAILPAIVGLARNVGKDIKGDPKEGEDWVDFFLERSGLLFDTIDGGNKASFGDFLRLYIAANADEDGGNPSTHVTQILGASRIDLSKTLASGVLAYSNEPDTGTMLQWMNFQEKIQSVLGREPTEEVLKGLISTFFEKDNEIIGHRKSSVCDSRYAAFSDFAREHMNEDPKVKLSRDISRIFISMANSSEKNVWPEQNILAAPIFQFYGLTDMEFNQTLLWMSRALGIVASIIWTRAIDIPVERPMSRCTYTYMNSFRKTQKKINPKL